MRRTPVIRFACCPMNRYQFVRIAARGTPEVEEVIMAGAKISMGCANCTRQCKRLVIKYAPVAPTKEREGKACQT